MARKFSIATGTVHKIPEDLRKALTSDSNALAKWNDLTPLARNEWICWAISVKKDETRREHIQRTISELKEGMRRPCCWIGCIHRMDKPISPSVQHVLNKKLKSNKDGPMPEHKNLPPKKKWDMASLHFSSNILIYNGNPYVHISSTRAQKLQAGWRKPMPVLVQINGEPNPPWRINMMPIGDGSFYLYLHGDVRKASKTKVGDRVTVDVSFDSIYRSGPMHPMPTWFGKALDKNVIAKKNWEALVPSRKKEILRYFSWLKSQEAIDRNLKRAMDVLSGKPGRFMARSWKSGA